MRKRNYSQCSRPAPIFAIIQQIKAIKALILMILSHDVLVKEKAQMSRKSDTRFEQIGSSKDINIYFR